MRSTAAGDLARQAAYFGVGAVLLAIYGTEVCPYLQGLGYLDLTLSLVVAFALALGLRVVLFSSLIGQSPPATRPWRVLLLDVAIWIVGGAIVTAYNVVAHGFPTESGLKLIVGSILLGIFAATANSLDAERALFDRKDRSTSSPGRFLSLSTRFFVFISAALVVVTVVLILLFKKDVETVAEMVGSGQSFEFRWVAQEVIFVTVVLLTGTLLVAYRWGRNLRRVFELQLAALAAVDRGELDSHVPVLSHDELGVIAEHTNRMIGGLRERARLEDAFGKYVNREVVQAILAQESEAELGGRELEAAVLFTDLQGFTTLSESLGPSEVVSFLNEYFEMVVATVHREGGVVDKFIGDAAMAVFGLDGSAHSCDAAARAALALHDGLGAVNERLVQKGLPALECGVGIDFGPLVAGNVGSSNRFEYTVIGDTVNTASRLESLTRKVGSPVVISASVYAHLEETTRARFAPLGEHALKGKAAPKLVYGSGSGAVSSTSDA